MERKLSSRYAKIFAVFAGLFFLCVFALADCTGRTTSAQPGSPFRPGTVFRLGNNQGDGYFHDSGTHQDGSFFSACAVDMNYGSGIADEGLAIIAVADGTVSAASHRTDGFGNTIIIDHSSTSRSWYSHLAFDPSKKPGLKVGDTVRRGSVIGFLGNTGTSTSAHLHFEWQEHVDGAWKSMDFTTMDGQTVQSGAQLTSSANNALTFPSGAVTYANGTFVKNANNDTIYYVDGGQLRAFTSAEHFRSWFPYYTSNMPIGAALPLANSATTSAYSTGANMSFRPGTLLRSDASGEYAPDCTYYLVYDDNGTIRKIAKTFSQISDMGYEEGSAMIVDASLINALPGGSGPTELYNTPLYTDINLVAYWRLEGNGTGEKNGYNLMAVNSPSYAAAKFGQGVDLGSANTNKEMMIGSMMSFASTTPITIAGWVKLNQEISSGEYKLFDLVKPGDNSVGFHVIAYYQYNGGTRRLVLARFGATGTTYALYNTSLGASNWHHIAVTWDGSSNGVGYVDGVSIGTFTSSGTSTAGGTEGFHIGSYASVQDFASAVFDDVAIFNRVLSSAEISSLYNGN